MSLVQLFQSMSTRITDAMCLIGREDTAVNKPMQGETIPPRSVSCASQRNRQLSALCLQVDRLTLEAISSNTTTYSVLQLLLYYSLCFIVLNLLKIFTTDFVQLCKDLYWLTRHWKFWERNIFLPACIPFRWQVCDNKFSKNSVYDEMSRCIRVARYNCKS